METLYSTVGEKMNFVDSDCDVTILLKETVAQQWVGQ
jgi:hypothetical protein